MEIIRYNTDDLLARQLKLADDNYRLLKERRVRAINVMGPVGSGKTSLIARLIERLIPCGIKVGAIAAAAVGDEDHRRFLETGAQSINLRTGEDGHIDAPGLNGALLGLDLTSIDVLFVENVPGIISPVDYPLGTDDEFVVIAAPAGGGAVRKYPRIFTQTDLLVVNKIDLAAAAAVKTEAVSDDYIRINPHGKIVLTDAKHGSGIDDLLAALGFECDAKW